MTYKHHTLKEIEHQPELWLKTYNTIKVQSQSINSFINEVLPASESEIIFTGAGSSFFIGEMVAAKYQGNSGVSSKAISSTEIVTHPELYINPAIHTLMVSFARSGNSPESVASVELANEISDRVAHLIITCNKEGELAKLSFKNKKYVLVMPEEANDKSLAMTSSVSTMALSALLISQLNKIDELKGQIEKISSYAQYIISTYKSELENIAKLNIKRAVFLGSGPNLGVARESHLKLQELTDGKLICKFDSFLGFRHGPKVVVDDETLLVYIFSNDEYVLQYEKDLVESMQKGVTPLFTLGVSEKKNTSLGLDLSIKLPVAFFGIEEEFLILCNLIPAQLFGYYKSIEQGLNPDSPSNNGTIHRVVQGVTIYPLSKTELLQKEL